MSSKVATPTDRPDDPWVPATTRPLPLVDGAAPARADGGDGADPATRPGTTRAWRRLVAAVRTPRGAGTAATLAGAALVLVVGMTTSPPSGVMELQAGPADLLATDQPGSGLPESGRPAQGSLPRVADRADPSSVTTRVAGTTGTEAPDVTVRLTAAGTPDALDAASAPRNDSAPGNGSAHGTAGARSASALTEIAAVEATPVAASLPSGCPVGAIEIWTPGGPLTVGAAVGVPVGVRLAADAPAACRQAAMTVAIAGTATVTGAGGQPVRVPVTGSVTFSPSR